MSEEKGSPAQCGQYERRRDDNHHVNPVGPCDLDRNFRPVGRASQELIWQWGGMPLLPNGPLTLTLPGQTCE